jgi:fermentation-respiration switch protein FrsA (DUF1100 family)
MNRGDYLKMRRDVTFTSSGLRCSGRLYLPDDLKMGEKAPAIVMAHGLSGVKEMGLSDYAERFVAAGFVTLVFDYRFFGGSEGEPRGQVFPLEQVEDYRNAITWVSERPEVDPQRIGVWGTSFSGGLVLHVGIHDIRVKAVVAQVPAALNPEIRRVINPEAWENARRTFVQNRIERYKTGEVKYIKVVSSENEPCVLPGSDAYEGYMTLGESAPTWRNQITLESLEKMREFDPVSMIHLISPRALLLIPAEKDEIIPLTAVKAAYEKAQEPKEMTALPIGHFEIYREPWLSKASSLAINWFEKFL